MRLITTPNDILSFMDNINYGYIDLNGHKYINEIPGFRKNFRALSNEEVLKNRVGTCIEQVYLMHCLLDGLNIPNKMFCTRVYENDDISDESEIQMHCFVLYYDKDGVHQIEHPNEKRKGIYDFESEEKAIEEINKIYTEISGGVPRSVTEFFEVQEGISFKEFNNYINTLDNNKNNIKV